MGICYHSSRNAFMRFLIHSALIHTKGVLQYLVEIRILLCAMVRSHVGTGMDHPQTHKVGSMKLTNLSWYSEALRVPFTGIKGPSPTSPSEKQPHTIIPPPPNFTLGTMKSGSYRFPGNRQTQTHPSDCQICHSRDHVSTVLRSSGGVLYTALHWTW